GRRDRRRILRARGSGLRTRSPKPERLGPRSAWISRPRRRAGAGRASTGFVSTPSRGYRGCKARNCSPTGAAQSGMTNRSNRSTARSPEQPPARDRGRQRVEESSGRAPLLLAFLLAAAIVAAYHNSVDGPFIFDDDGIVEKLRNHRLSAWSMATGSTRPLVQLSFAANYALGGVDVRGYHLVNL